MTKQLNNLLMRHLAIACLLLGCVYANARQISPSEAMTLASDFMNSEELTTASGTNTLTPMRAPGVSADSQSPYYVFNRGEADGFVIISGDDRAPKILGYSDRGSFDASNLPPQLKAMMELWATQMGQLPVGAGQHPSWNNAPATRAEECILMETAEWGQGYPFNALCPIIEGEQAPAGCVSTAMAIAMKYHNWPDYTRGGMQDDFYYPEFTLDFSNYSIDWNILEDKNNPGFADEVSKLMYSTGVAAQMIYGPFESAADMWPLGHKMVELYAYSKGCQYIEKNKFDDRVWVDMLNDQLREVGPVIYRGSGDIGHAFVIDGFDGNDLYHVNWGWDGLLNGYFTLDFSDVGGSSFADDQGMIINIKPDKERKEYSKSFIPDFDAYFSGIVGCGGWNFMAPDIQPGELMKFKTPSIVLNGFVGYFDIAVVDEDDNILQLLGMQHHSNDGSRHCVYPGMEPVAYVTFPELKEGQRFQLVSMDAVWDIDKLEFDVPRSQNPEDWKLILGGLVYPSYFYDHGNKSELTEINVHVDEELPFLFFMNNKVEREFSYLDLKGADSPEIVMIPQKGVSVELLCYDKDGTPADPVYVGGPGPCSELISITISLFSDKYDLYLKYEKDLDTRKDSSLQKESIVDQDGLVYQILENGVSLIGYDNVGEAVVIPEFVESQGNVYPVVQIGKDALLHAPIKDLTIMSARLDEIGGCAFAGMTCLNSLSFEDTQLNTTPWYRSFLNTNMKRVYLNNFNPGWFLYHIMNANFDESYYQSYVIGNPDIDFYINEEPQNIANGWYSNFIDLLGMPKRTFGCEKVVNSINFPGLGNHPNVQYWKDETLPIHELWSYAIDRDHNAFMIRPESEDVEILKVSANGENVTPDENCIYSVPSIQDIEITVSYILNGVKEMATTYNASFNNELPSQTITDGIEGIIVGGNASSVYTLEGIFVTNVSEDEDFKSLTPGIYIIRRGAETQKLVIR